MTPQEAIQNLNQECAIAQHRCGCKINGTDCDSCYIWTAIKALELKADLIKEIPTFKEVIQANYEIFKKYSINYHTEIEEIAFNNFDKTVVNLQWLIGELE